MDMLLLAVFFVIVLAIFFDFVNGFHDSSNVVATMIASRSMSPEVALVISAVANFLGPFIFGTAVAKTIGKEIVDPSVIDVWVVCGALVGAIVWNLLTWWFGLPSSSSHALVGGIIGAVVAAGDWASLKGPGVTKIIVVLITSPVVGFIVGFLFLKISGFLARGQTPGVNVFFKKSQLVSSIALSLSHGTNDAQKSMGIITMVLVAYYKVHPEVISHYPFLMSLETVNEFKVPLWTIFFCALAMGLGTAFGGWKIIKTVGSGIFKLRPIHGFSAQTAAATVIMAASHFGFPVSTTHVVSSGIMGVGGAERIKAVKWHKAGEIISTWFLTIPAAAVVSALTYWAVILLKKIF